MPKFSIIIPSLGRSQSLFDCKESLYQQTEQDFEIIIVSEEGPLAALRNKGAKKAKGTYLVFTDDDVIAEPQWLQAILSAFEQGAKGVSGPSYTKNEFRKNRDCFNFPVELFSSRRCGEISRWGQWSLAATKETCSYHGFVDYLEACNMSFEAEAFWSVGGFDETYKGIGDWSEPDLCYRLRQAGHCLWFSENARLEHRPATSGAYKKRLAPCNRMENYELFSKRWIIPCWQHSLYKLLMKGYFAWKQTGTKNIER